ncbi:MAG: acetyl-CoA C-acetyltransferase [Hyphomonadaceae bacterium]|nr:acetyl-CoA C-acetyltransferase [Hyphomonadaceae bacterium]
MREALICEPVRTPVGRFGGVLKDKSVVELGVAAVAGLLGRVKLPADAVDDVIFAQCYPSMEAPALGRVVALDAGLPISTPGIQIDRRCGSGLQAIIYASMQVATGGADVMIAGGAESMSNAAFFTHQARWGAAGEGMMLHDSLARGRVTAGGKNFPVPGGMIETAENLRREYGISRQEQDAFSVESHKRAVAAQQAGRFDDEIIPIAVTQKKETKLVQQDEHPRPDVSLEALAKLKPILASRDGEATVTAGNASGQNDGGAACIIATREAADRYGLRPFATLKSWAVAGVEPKIMGIGPVPATAKALARAGLELKHIDLIELNEAFAAQVLACTREWKFCADDFARFNVNGSGISLGHPVGATGGRILATLLREMDRRDARYGLETMCIGGGQGLTAVFERASG